MSAFLLLLLLFHFPHFGSNSILFSHIWYLQFYRCFAPGNQELWQIYTLFLFSFASTLLRVRMSSRGRLIMHVYISDDGP